MRPDVCDNVHESLDSVHLDKLVEAAVRLEGRSYDGAISDGQKLRLNGLQVWPVLANTAVLGIVFFTLERTSVSVALPAVRPETQMTSGIVVKDRCFCNLSDVLFCDI